MSESLRRTLGFDFDFDKFGGDDSGEGPVAEGPVAGSSGTAPLPVPVHGSPEEDRFDSMGDSADHLLAQYMELATTPPRATRRQKEKKAYRSQAQAASRQLKASLRRRSSLDQYLSLPVFAENAGGEPTRGSALLGGDHGGCFVHGGDMVHAPVARRMQFVRGLCPA